MSEITEFDNEIRIAVYQFFVDEERAPVAAEIAKIISSTPRQVEDAYRRLHDAHVLVLAPGTPHIWMANPLSALPTPHMVGCNDKAFWGNCIWDALGIVAMLGSGGSVTSRCPDCGDELKLEIRDGRVSDSNYVVHFAVPAARWWDDIGFA
ncbi:MAG: organomercurial lyase [Actinomycetota bacterium]